MEGQVKTRHLLNKTFNTTQVHTNIHTYLSRQCPATTTTTHYMGWTGANNM